MRPGGKPATVFCGLGLCLILLVGLGHRAAAAPPALAPAAPDVPAACSEGVQASGALYQICLRAADWNGDLIVYAHGYIPATEPLALPAEASLIATVANAMGYAFATSSYRVNGLAVLPAIEDLLELVEIVRSFHPALDQVYLLGFSEGGLVATLSVEATPDVYVGGVAGCAPVGYFQGQLDYIMDYRLVFDYLFPGLMPGHPLAVPQSLIDDWDHHFDTVIAPALTAPENVARVTQLLAVTGAPTEWTLVSQTSYEVLRYQVMGTADLLQKLGGSPFDNRSRVYSGSADDTALNAAILRLAADPVARAAVTAYETSGVLPAPLVLIHSRQDPVVPFWHQALYQARVYAADNAARWDLITVDQYGHCAFTLEDILAAFTLLQARVAEPPPYQPIRFGLLPLVAAP